ncbi:peptidylprolyl isomerase [Candidatus Bandiella euplotis]|uniref:Parvulin-like PPIase n=1 Tax=Candidatus Bandiella euplotis TaxID=1664265 RepID=A0ABZ0UNX7_9RICK|nr:SurA N-terminal domain-containing protein [Candidatus Bandiella woodruffii]WPX96555.1 Putative SurA-like peptidyl-prolyl cys-trans isomerase domain protein [Candidatus Bandiella woodruffii]
MTNLFRSIKLLIAAALIVSSSTEVLAEQDYIVAYVNNEIITSYDLKKRVELAESINKVKISSKEAKQSILQTLIDEKLIAQIARRNNISVPKEQVMSYIGLIAKDNGVSNLEQLAKRYKISPAEFMKQIEGQLLLKKLVQIQIAPDTKVSQQETHDNLNNISANVVQSSNVEASSDVKISEIVLYKQSLKQADMQKLLNNLYLQLKQGIAFEDLARQFSESPSASSGGSIGWVKLGQLAKPIADAIEQDLVHFKTGRVTAHPIDIDDRVILVKLVDTRAGKKVIKKVSEEEVQDVLFNQKLSINVRNFINNLRKNSYIHIKNS